MQACDQVGLALAIGTAVVLGVLLVIVCVASEMRGADAELYRRDKRVLSRRIERLLAAVDSAAACAHQLGADAVEQTLRDGVRAAIETPDEGDA